MNVPNINSTSSHWICSERQSTARSANILQYEKMERRSGKHTCACARLVWKWIRRCQTLNKRWIRIWLTITNYHHFSIVGPNDHRRLAYHTNAYQIWIATVSRCLLARFSIFHLCHFFSFSFFLCFSLWFNFLLILYLFVVARRLPSVRHPHRINCVRNVQITTFSFVSRRLNYIPTGTGCFATAKKSLFVMNININVGWLRYCTLYKHQIHSHTMSLFPGG